MKPRFIIDNPPISSLSFSPAGGSRMLTIAWYPSCGRHRLEELMSHYDITCQKFIKDIISLTQKVSNIWQGRGLTTRLTTCSAESLHRNSPVEEFSLTFLTSSTEILVVENKLKQLGERISLIKLTTVHHFS